MIPDCRRSPGRSDPGDPALGPTIADLYETMATADGVGLRLTIFGFEYNLRYPDAPSVPVTALINPSLEILTEETEDGWEDCLSVRGLVPHATDIRYGGTLEGGGRIEREAHGFHARVFQHEFDHVDGVP